MGSGEKDHCRLGQVKLTVDVNLNLIGFARLEQALGHILISNRLHNWGPKWYSGTLGVKYINIQVCSLRHNWVHYIKIPNEIWCIVCQIGFSHQYFGPGSKTQVWGSFPCMG